MPVNPIDAPAALDLRLRETAVGVNSKRPNTTKTTQQTQAEPGAVAPAAPVSSAAVSAAELLQAESQVQQEAPEQHQPTVPLPTTMNLKFSTDEKTGKSVVALVDPVDGKVLRQFPSDEALKVAEAIGRFQGMFVDLKV
jgi:flagellar protein FlaG